MCRRIEALEEQVETLQAEVQSRDADERRVAAILVAIREAAHVVTFTAASTAKEQLVEFTSAVCDTITEELVNECMNLSTPAHGIAKHARELLVEGILGNAPQPRSEPSGGQGRSLARINLEDFI